MYHCGRCRALTWPIVAIAVYTHAESLLCPPAASTVSSVGYGSVKREEKKFVRIAKV